MKKQDKPKRSRGRTANNRTTTGFRITDELWAVLQPLLPIHVNTHRFGGGRPRMPDRDCADAIFYVLRTGCQWQALDQTPWRFVCKEGQSMSKQEEKTSTPSQEVLTEQEKRGEIAKVIKEEAH